MHFLCNSFARSLLYRDIINNAKLNYKTMDQLKGQLLQLEATRSFHQLDQQLSSSSSNHSLSDNAAKRARFTDHSSFGSSSASAMLSATTNQVRPQVICQYCNKPGHTAAKCFHVVPCSICHKRGHTAQKCHQHRRGNSSAHLKVTQSASTDSTSFRNSQLLNQGE